MEWMMWASKDGSDIFQKLVSKRAKLAAWKRVFVKVGEMASWESCKYTTASVNVR